MKYFSFQWMRNPDTLQEVVEGKVAEVGGKERFTLKLSRTVARYFEAVFRSISSCLGFGDCVVPGDCFFSCTGTTMESLTG